MSNKNNKNEVKEQELKTKKEVEEEKDRLEHPYGNMKDDELMKTIFNHAKNTNSMKFNGGKKTLFGNFDFYKRPQFALETKFL